MQKKHIYIDGDVILHQAYAIETKTEDKSWGEVEEGDDFGLEVEPSLKNMKKIFKSIVSSYEDTAQVESIANDWTTGKTHVVISGKDNFRYDINPDYKSGRPPKTKIYKKFRKWARKKYICTTQVECDDYLSYYMREGHLIFTLDKDIMHSNEGTAFNVHRFHLKWVYTSAKMGDDFFKLQSLMGDLGDGIVGIDGYAKKSAQKVLDIDDSWENILAEYIRKGYTKEYCLMTIRCVCMTQWHPKTGLTMWEFPDEKGLQKPKKKSKK